MAEYSRFGYVNAPMLAETVSDLMEVCGRLGVDGYEGEAIAFLDAIMLLATGDAETPEEAVSMAYGLED